jgi:hypothetical protein
MHAEPCGHIEYDVRVVIDVPPIVYEPGGDGNAIELISGQYTLGAPHASARDEVEP